MRNIARVILIASIIPAIGLGLLIHTPNTGYDRWQYYALFGCSCLCFLASAGYLIYFRFRKDLHPEFLHGRLDSQVILESGGVKFSGLAGGEEVIQGGVLMVFILLENSYDSIRYIRPRISLSPRIAVKQRNNLKYNDTAEIMLKGGEFGILIVPVFVSDDASSGRYIFNLTADAHYSSSGKRTRMKEGYTGSTGGKRFLSLLSLLTFAGMAMRDLQIVFRVKKKETSGENISIPPEGLRHFQEKDHLPYKYMELWNPVENDHNDSVVKKVWDKIRNILSFSYLDF